MRLFGGQIELRFQHVVDIVKAMGMTVDEFFAFAYPRRVAAPTDPARQLNRMLDELRPAPPGPPRLTALEEEQRRQLEETVASMMRRLSADENERKKAG